MLSSCWRKGANVSIAMDGGHTVLHFSAQEGKLTAVTVDLVRPAQTWKQR